MEYIVNFYSEMKNENPFQFQPTLFQEDTSIYSNSKLFMMKNFFKDFMVLDLMI